MNSPSPLRIGIDIGGTFTDFVILDPRKGGINTFKVLSTPADPSKAVLEGFRRITSQEQSKVSPNIFHGSTVATNALLERKGAATALITTRGFRDILQIGRQNRSSLYDFHADPPPPLIPKELRFDVSERVDHSGRVLETLQPSQIDELIFKLRSNHIRSVAVCLLFSFRYPDHEEEITRRLREAGFFVSSSVEILPEFREFERTSTTVINAYVSPILDIYLSELESSLDYGYFQIMQSNGGVINLHESKRAGIRCILSGPAGGVVGSQYIASHTLTNGHHAKADSIKNNSLKVITFDMGGTSTDVSLIDGLPRLSTSTQIAGYPINIPMLDIHTIGAGGGSIAKVDLGGALRVGPESAGAQPGPACYARVDINQAFPTVTDANLVLGRIDPSNFLGGQMHLEADRSWHVMSALGKQIGLDGTQAALGVIEVTNAHMERALRVISVERGHDPREFILLSFGGAGGLHAGDLANRLGVPRVLIPALASTLSAFGMLTADVVKDYTHTVMAPSGTPYSDLQALFKPLEARAYTEIQSEGIPVEKIAMEKYVDVRYRGQAYELTIEFDTQMEDRFHQAHFQAYGYYREDAPVEFVNLRVRVTSEVEKPLLTSHQCKDNPTQPAWMEVKSVVFREGGLETPFYRWEDLRPGQKIEGPGVIVREDTTVLVNPGDYVILDEYSNIMMIIGG